MKTFQSLKKGLFVAGCILLFAQCAGKDAKTATGETAAAPADLATLPVAYVDADSLLSGFDFYNKLISGYEDKLAKLNSTRQAGEQKLQNEAAAFQQKVQNNGFLTQERAEQEYARIQRMQDDLQKKLSQSGQELNLEYQNIQQQLSDSLAAGIKEFNTPQKYQLIFTKTGNSALLYANPEYNITTPVLEFLNKRFKTEK